MPFQEIAVRAESTDEAEVRISERYGRVALDGEPRYEERALGDERFVIGRVAMSSGFRARLEVDGVTIGSSSENFEWSTGSRSGVLQSRPALFQPGQVVTTRSTAAVFLTTVTLAPEALTRHAAAVYGPGTLVRFRDEFPVGAQTARRWRQEVEQLAELPLAIDLIRHHAYGVLATSVLEQFRLAGDVTARRRVALLRAEAYRRAAQFFEDHAGEAIGVPDAAAAAEVSVRDLRRLFSIYSTRGWTPERHLLHARLSGAHDELLAMSGEAADPPIATVAARWGFTAARLIRLHREVYGTLPREVGTTRRGS